MSQESLGIGKLIESEQARDAIHVAVYPASALQDLQPGWRVAMLDRKRGLVKYTTGDDAIGIVDPFLRDATIPTGRKFWVFLNPGSITSLRHDWTHPALDLDNESMQWIVDFATRVGLGYEEIMDAARDWIEHGEYYVFDHDEHGESFNLEFWTHYERVTGTVVSSNDRDNFFSCSC